MSATINREQRAKGLLKEGGAIVSPEVSTPLPRPVPPAPRPPHGEVFSINFIRHETVPLRIRRTLIYIALGYLAANGIVMVGLIGAGICIRSQWHQVQTRIQQQTASAETMGVVTKEMEALHARAANDLNRLSTVIALQQRHFPVAGKLAALTKTLPARTWITSLSGDREKRTMTMHAAYLMDPENPYELPAKSWVEGLRADPAFRQGLKRLELGSSSRKSQGSAKLFVFDLVAEWEPIAK